MCTQNQKKKNFLCADDFGVKDLNKDDADHLLESLKKHYVISTDWEGRNYLGLTINCNYIEEYVNISMPEYVKKRWIDFNILIQKDLNMLHISGQYLLMKKYFRWHHHQMIVILLKENQPKE